MSDASELVLKTTPFDKKHFPATNQAHYCWQKYNEYVLCAKKTGGEDSCKTQKQLAWSICPDEWISQWDSERKEGRFMGIQEKAAPKSHHAHH